MDYFGGGNQLHLFAMTSNDFEKTNNHVNVADLAES